MKQKTASGVQTAHPQEVKSEKHQNQPMSQLEQNPKNQPQALGNINVKKQGRFFFSQPLSHESGTGAAATAATSETEATAADGADQ